ncbi:MAG: hypothetical protein KatS3mg076_2128 [Candidatus Binatia bacterium]|nr:MAG: hypothetical protein KatS3mg076_2128 [Candidatus Binatia bacterium]
MRRRAASKTVALLAALALAGCDGDAEDARSARSPAAATATPTETFTPSFSPTESSPTATPTASASPTRTPTFTFPPTATLTPAPAVCGNGIVEEGEACDDGNFDPYDRCTDTCAVGPVDFETISLPSRARPPHVPDGSPERAPAEGSTLAEQFGTTLFDLNVALATRYFLRDAGPPSVVLVLVPGFAGGAGSFRILAENLLVRARDLGVPGLEVWAFDRRSNLLEDTAGAELAEELRDPFLSLDWFFGEWLGLPRSPALARRAVFHEGEDLAFLAEYTSHTLVRDIDAVVEFARALPSRPFVFLGGHSLGTAFAAKYAATDFDPGTGTEPGYAKLAGLVLLEGGGGGTGPEPDDDALDLVIAKADGGLYHAVRAGEPRCVDGTPCATDEDCASVPLPPGALRNRCVAPTEAFLGAGSGPLSINPKIQAAGRVVALQAQVAPDELALVQRRFEAGSAVLRVPGLGALGLLPPASPEAGLGFFLDDDFSPIPAFRASFGFSNDGPNSETGGFLFPLPAFDGTFRKWIGIHESLPPEALPDNGPLAAADRVWGKEKEVTDLGRLLAAFTDGELDFGDWYFPSSGLSVTRELDLAAGFANLDTRALSERRGRPDIENLTLAGEIDIPVLCVGASNGLVPSGAGFRNLASALGPCRAEGCDGTPRLVRDDPLRPEFGGRAGGFEVVLAEGFAHVDVLTAEDGPDNPVVGAILDFVLRPLR